MEIKSVLKEIGLTEKEAAVYLATLELGESSVLRIAKKAAVKRPTAYVTLDALQERGLVLSIPKGTTTLYQAIDPEEVVRRFDERVGSLKKVLPELKSLFNAVPGKPKVRFYEGKKNILALYEDEIFRSGEVLSAFSPKDWVSAYSSEEMRNLLGLMRSNGITIRDLLQESPEAHEYMKEKERLGLGESKFLPKDFSIGVDVLIYGNTVVMVSFRNLIAVAIEDPTISNAQKQFLEFLWRSI